MTDRCPTSNELAALVDGGLEPAARDAILAHLVACENCAEVVGEVAAFREQEEEPERAPERPESGTMTAGSAAEARRRPTMRRALALAAVLLTALGATIAWWVRTGDDAPIRRIARLSPDHRTFSSRLTGLAYRPYRATRGSEDGDELWGLRAEIGRLGELVDERPTAPRLHALGTASLLLGEPGRAVEALERAQGLESDPAIAIDLAAARIELGAATGDDRPITLGLRVLDDLLTETTGDDPRWPVLLYDRALALELLGRTDEARDAWDLYLESDPDSPWAAEARERLRRLSDPRGS